MCSSTELAPTSEVRGVSFSWFSVSLRKKRKKKENVLAWPIDAFSWAKKAAEDRFQLAKRVRTQDWFGSCYHQWALFGLSLNLSL
uniref:Uncharacterized protein n=1 Tax=Nelumbo nucifera TaxID=4432 RepID=A0A822ZNM4_NELNU|nr:TPA_asm: hypothetical protein HUJ06_016759 [Nelumbo nucifera]